MPLARRRGRRRFQLAPAAHHLSARGGDEGRGHRVPPRDRAGANVSADARASARGPVAIGAPPVGVSGRQARPPAAEGQIKPGVQGVRLT